MRPFWDSGRVRPLAVTGAVRLSGLAQLPTMREEGVADYDVTSWFATYAAVKTPPAVVATLRDMMQKAAGAPGFLEVLSKGAMDPLDLVGEDINALTRRELEMWGRVVKASGLAPAK
jgi:tripartite-type tricarboxylate transporter receptor subunit TctC